MFLSDKPWSSLLEFLWLYMVSTAVILFTVLVILVTKYFKMKTLKKVTVISILGENMAKDRRM